jgi:hypothetical protein
MFYHLKLTLELKIEKRDDFDPNILNFDDSSMRTEEEDMIAEEDYEEGYVLATVEPACGGRWMNP